MRLEDEIRSRSSLVVLLAYFLSFWGALLLQSWIEQTLTPKVTTPTTFLGGVVTVAILFVLARYGFPFLLMYAYKKGVLKT